MAAIARSRKKQVITSAQVSAVTVPTLAIEHAAMNSRTMRINSASPENSTLSHVSRAVDNN
jgi:hypothetical protein